MPSTAPQVARLAGGEYVVSHIATDALQFALYDADGALVRVYDRQGEGPGELSAAPSLYVQPGDTLVAYDRRLGRITRFDASLDLLDTRLAQAPLGYHVVFPAPDRVAQGSGVETGAPDRVASQIVRLDGTPLARFDERSPGGEVVLGGAVAPGRFWVMPLDGHTARLYEAEGEVRREVELDRTWFEPWTAPKHAEPYQERPRPRNAGVTDLAPDRLLVVTWRADPDWAPLFGPDEPEALDFSELEDSRFWATVLEVYHARTGDLLGTLEVDEALYRVRILEPELVEPGRAP